MESATVSCILLTRNRQTLAAQAIWYFLRQDYPHRTLIVVDDSVRSIEDLIPPDDRIRYARVSHALTLGAKRNFANSLAQGEFIAHWDDDDWQSPQRLSLQVEALIASGAEVCGARDLLYYALDAGQAWQYRCPARGAWAAGCSLLYRRSAWESHPFPEINVGEDSAFVRQFDPQQICVPDQPFMIGLIHAQNVAAKRLRDPAWEQRPLGEVTSLLADDRDFYVTLRHGESVARQADRPQSSVTVRATFNVFSGYGSMAEYLALSMARLGVTVNPRPIAINTEGLSGEFLDLWHRSKPDAHAPVVFFHWLNADVDALGGDLFINTMYESSRLPPGWAEKLNRARAVIAPTRFVARIMRDSGVTVPIEVIPEGVDPAVYPYVEREQRPGLVTLIVAPVDERKNTTAGIAAWKQAFAGDPDARLIIKSSYDYQNYQPDDPRIRYYDLPERTRGILRWYAQADVLLALGSEGFGLPMVEGMATGLPVIALNSEGQADAVEDAPGLLLPVDPVALKPHAPSGGVHGVPGVEAVADRLRWVAEHRAEASELGRAASVWAHAQRNVWAKGAAVIDLIERSTRRPLRKRRTIWTPSWGDECGIAEYTASLIMPLSGVRVTRAAPDWRSAKLIHVQHEASLFHDLALTRTVQAARRARVPVIITEHSVIDQASAWERDASALVALTERGADKLRARCPDKPVEHIPIGCDQWFPTRKAKRGRVIGAFGFLQRHKGFWDLLDALRAIPEAELVIYSRARSPQTEAEWEAAAAGLPVRRCADYLPVEEIARRLAAEADILVYWYHDLPVASASAAVRVGLATGVPVMTSPIPMFSELTNETYQPDDLIAGIRRLLDDTALRDRVSDAAREYCNANSWSRIAERHVALWQRIE